MAKKEKADIWMPLYIGDYLADTIRLTAEQHGAYLLLLMEHWMRGPIPDDDEVLSQITRLPIDRWNKTRGLFLGYFSVIDGFWINKRCTAEKQKADAFLAKQKANGAKGGRPKNPKNPNETQTEPNSKAKHNPNESPSPSPSPSQLKEEKNIRTPKADAFGVLDILASFPTLPESIAADYISHRKAKKAPLTQTAWNAIVKQILKSGMPPSEALELAMNRNWQGFDASWLQEKPQRYNGKQTQDDITNWVPSSMRGTPDDPLFNQDYIDAIQ